MKRYFWIHIQRAGYAEVFLGKVYCTRASLERSLRHIGAGRCWTVEDNGAVHIR